MIDKCKIYDLMPSVPIASCSLVNTLTPENPDQNYPGKPIALHVLNKNLFYHNQRLLSTRLSLDYHRESPQIIKPKTLSDLLVKVIKSVKSPEHFF